MFYILKTLSHLSIPMISRSTSNKNTHRPTQRPAFKRGEVLILKGWGLIAPPLQDSLEGRGTPCLGSHWGSFSAGRAIYPPEGLLIYVPQSYSPLCLCLHNKHTSSQIQGAAHKQNSVYSCKLSFLLFCTGSLFHLS